MKRIAGMLLLATIAVVFTVGSASAQLQQPGISGGGSCYQVPGSDVDSGSPAMQFGNLGWNSFLTVRANRLLLAISRWRPAVNHSLIVAPARVPNVGTRAAR